MAGNKRMSRDVGNEWQTTGGKQQYVIGQKIIKMDALFALEAMARQIAQLRMKELGYKSIGIVVGTSRENIPSRCKFCGKRIERNPKSGKKLFCSDECLRAWWKQHPEKSIHSQEATYTPECAYCKRYFSAYWNKFRI